MAAISSVPHSALPPNPRGNVPLPGPPGGLTTELTSSFLSLWTHYAGTEPTRAHTEIRGNVVTCTLVDSVDDYDRKMATRKAGAPVGEVKLSEAAYSRDAIATIGRLTHQRVISFVSSHDRDTDVATEVFTLEPSLGRGARPSRLLEKTSPHRSG